MHDIRGLLVVSLMRSATVQSSFALVGPSSWNNLAKQLRLELLTLPLPVLWKRPKTILFLLVIGSTGLGRKRL